MFEVLPALSAAYERGETCALATVVRTWRSAPRQAGASMVVTEGGEAFGSISGGCVEGAVFQAGAAVVADGRARFETYGVDDADAFAVGLTCGGLIDVFIQAVSPSTWPELPVVVTAVAAMESVAVATVVVAPDDGSPVVVPGRHVVVLPDGKAGTMGWARLDDAVCEDGRGLLESGQTAVVEYGPHGERLGTGLEVFVTSFATPPEMYIFGAVDYSAALARVAKLLGFRVTVCDARPVFTTGKRFPDADEVVVDWPHRWLAGRTVDARTVICVLTHDPKFDVPLLEVALRTDAAYVGAMGSRQTHDDRLRRLEKAGMTPEELARLSSPIGLDIGAHTPEETAVSIAAEIVQLRWRGSGRRLSDVDGPIHHRSDQGVQAPQAGPDR